MAGQTILKRVLCTKPPERREARRGRPGGLSERGCAFLMRLSRQEWGGSRARGALVGRVMRSAAADQLAGELRGVGAAGAPGDDLDGRGVEGVDDGHEHLADGSPRGTRAPWRYRTRSFLNEQYFLYLVLEIKRKSAHRRAFFWDGYNAATIAAAHSARFKPAVRTRV